MLVVPPSIRPSEADIKRSPLNAYLVTGESSSGMNLRPSMEHPLIDESHLESDIKRELAFTIEDLGG